MTACKSYKRQIALLAAQALKEDEQRAVLDHLEHCPACQAYRNHLQVIVGLYEQDAERAVAPSANSLSLRRYERTERRWIGLPRAAILAAAAVVVLCSALLVLRQSLDDTSGPPMPITQNAAATTRDGPLSIANTRHLAGQDLDDLLKLDTASRPHRADFVFSAGMRHEDP